MDLLLKIGFIIPMIMGVLVLSFLIVLGTYAELIVKPNFDTTLPTKIGWELENQGIFNKNIDCWGETSYSLGDSILPTSLSRYINRNIENINYINLQNGMGYSVYKKTYNYIGLLPITFHIIESTNCDLK